jgi:tight adherence protein B
MIALAMALCAAYGAFLLYTSLAFGWQGLRVGASPTSGWFRAHRHRADEWLAQAGLPDVAPRDLLVACGALLSGGAALGFLVFGGLAPALLAGLFSAITPIAVYRRRRRSRRLVAQDAWPGLVEEMRVLTTNAGRSIPQALFEVGASAPPQMRAAFEGGRREWLMSTDFDRTVGVLKAQLADASADTVLETLLVAHDLGGVDLDRRLEALADDRRVDAQYRKDVLARQAGVRFARRFVLIVPAGMALAGLSVGNGRAAYQTAFGQLAVAGALAMIVVCWLWAGHFMRLPEAQRVFNR